MTRKIRVNTSLLLLMLCLTTFFILVIGFLLSRTMADINNEYRGNLDFRSVLMSQSIKSNLVMGDYAEALGKAQDFFQQSDVAAVKISLIDGTNIAEFKNANLLENPKLFFETQGNIAIEDDSRQERSIIAEIRITYSLINLNRILNSFIARVSSATLFFLVLTLFAILYFSKLLNKPLKSLSILVSSGDLQKIIEVKKESSILELYSLEVAIGQMGEQILDLNRKESENIRSVAIGRFVAHLTHDLRAPLGTFERLLHIPDAIVPSMRNAVRDSLNRLNSMIESLRRSELESLVKKSATRIDFACGRESLQDKAAERGIALHLPLEDSGEVWIDPMKVDRAWINLATNAIEAARSIVRVEVEKVGTSLLLRVIDDGPGVPDNILPKLFQRGITSGKAGGTGLGLAYVRQISQGHGGDVAYRRGNGLTVFECSLPYAVAPVEANLPAPKELPAIDERMSPKQISICFTPDSYGESLISILGNFQNPSFTFANHYSAESVIVVTNDDDLSLRSLNEGKETIRISKVLPAEELANRVAYRLGIKN